MRTFVQTGEIVIVAVFLVGMVASAFDLATRRIPNSVTVGAAVVALVFRCWTAGWSGLALGAFGLAVGLLVMFPVFALGGLGAGDVKLLAAIGAWVGPLEALRTAMFAAMAGAVMAVVVVIVAGYVKQAFRNIWLLLSHWRVAGMKPLPALTLEYGRGPRLPYALPITAGAVVALWLH